MENNNNEMYQEFEQEEIFDNINENQNNNDDIDKNNKILSLENELNFVKKKNEELNSEFDKLKSSIIDNDIKENEINNLKNELNKRDFQIKMMNEENIKLKSDIEKLTHFIMNSLTPLGINIPELLLVNDDNNINDENNEFNINKEYKEKYNIENNSNILIEFYIIKNHLILVVIKLSQKIL